MSHGGNTPLDPFWSQWVVLRNITRAIPPPHAIDFPLLVTRLTVVPFLTDIALLNIPQLPVSRETSSLSRIGGRPLVRHAKESEQ